jgi:hypothetical protein
MHLATAAAARHRFEHFAAAAVGPNIKPCAPTLCHSQLHAVASAGRHPYPYGIPAFPQTIGKYSAIFQ